MPFRASLSVLNECIHVPNSGRFPALIIKCAPLLILAQHIPMIKTLHLKNFRGFEDHLVPLHQKTIIVGKNNAGKSTIVESLRLISLVANRYQRLQFSNVPRWLDLPKREKGVAPSLRNTEINLDSVFNNYADPPAVIAAVFESGATVTIYVGEEGEIHAVLRNAKGEIISNSSSAQTLVLPDIYILPQVSPLQREEKILTPEYVRRALYSSLSSMHFRNQLNIYYDDFFAEFKELAESSWPGLRILDLEGRGKLPGQATLSLLVQDSGFVAEAAWMGHGLQMWFQAMWFLTNEFALDDTIILDEPDVYMHADLQRRLVRLLRNRPQQIIIATHSTEILAEVEPEHVLVVDRRRSESKFATSLPAVQRVLENIGSAHNIQLTRLWSARRFLLVEGKDITLLKRFHDTLFPDSSEPLDAIPHNSIGGWSGWNNAVGSSLFLKNAGGDDITTYCVLDSDYHTPEQIRGRLESAHSHAVELHIWTRKEIENYLIVPTAIQRIVKSSAKANCPTVDEISERLIVITDGIREETFDAMANDFHLDDRAGGIARANQRARRRIDDAWVNLNERLTVVSGKRVLSMLSEWTKSAFGVSFGAARIAQELRSDEIDAEMRSVVGAIENNLKFIRPTVYA
jgi:hypothetical protein